MCFVPILCAKNYVVQYYKIKLLLKFMCLKSFMYIDVLSLPGNGFITNQKPYITF